MSYLMLFWAIVAAASSSIAGGIFNRRAGKKQGLSLLYSLLVCCAATVGWGVLFLFEPEFSLRALPYAAIFGGCYAIVQIFLILALQNGPVALSSLILHAAQIVTVIWGFFFWNTQFSARVVVGLALICLASYLCIYQKNPEERPSLKWLVFILIALAANSGCTIAQRSAVIALDGKYGSMMMFFALSFATVICAIVFALAPREKLSEELEKHWVIPVGGGWMNVMLNFLVIRLALSELSPNLIYPTISVGSLALNIVASLFLFKERINRQQAVGFALGAVAVILLS